MPSKPETTVTWTEDEIDFGPDVVLDPSRPLVIYDDRHAGEALGAILAGYVDLNDASADDWAAHCSGNTAVSTQEMEALADDIEAAGLSYIDLVRDDPS